MYIVYARSLTIFFLICFDEKKKEQKREDEILSISLREGERKMGKSRAF
jgi:hypothetical protein